MNDDRGASWNDEPDRQRRHRPANDRGHSIPPRDQYVDGPPDDRAYPIGMPGRGVDPPDYLDPRYDRPPFPSDRGGGYPPDGYAGHNGYPPDGYAGHNGYPADGYAGHDGYPAGGYAGQDGYPDPAGYGPYGGVADPGYPTDPYTSGHHAASGYEPPDPGMFDPRAQRPRTGAPWAGDPRVGDPRAGDPRFVDPRFIDPRAVDPRAVDPRGRGGWPAEYGDPGYPAGGYPPDGIEAGYPTGNFIEQGFGDAATGQFDPEDTTAGRGARRVRTGDTDPRGRRTGDTDPRGRRGGDTDPRGRRASRSRGAEPPQAGDLSGTFYEPDEAPRRRRRSPVVLAIVVAMLLVVGVGIYWGVGKVTDYFGTPDYSGTGTGTVKVKVAKGDFASNIADTLVKDQVIKSQKAFIHAADADPKSRNIQAGWYTLHMHMSAANALKMLEAVDGNGNPVNAFVFKVTIPEGSISVDIYAALSKATGIPVANFVVAAKDPVALGVDKSWFVGKTHNGRPFIKSIEGFLFPATYSFAPDETAKQMLTDMVHTFNKVVAPDDLDIVSAAKRLGMAPYEVLITASIAQEEASNAADMAGVVEVIYNRIYRTGGGDAGDFLSIDSEVNYWLKVNNRAPKDSSQLTFAELHSKSDPYNTHDNPGLPPGAIGNPGRDALTGAIRPDSSKRGYYYWQTVAGNPKVLFARTYSQFRAQQK